MNAIRADGPDVTWLFLLELVGRDSNWSRHLSHHSKNDDPFLDSITKTRRKSNSKNNKIGVSRIGRKDLKSRWLNNQVEAIEKTHMEMKTNIRSTGFQLSRCLSRYHMKQPEEWHFMRAVKTLEVIIVFKLRYTIWGTATHCGLTCSTPPHP